MKDRIKKYRRFMRVLLPLLAAAIMTAAVWLLPLGGADDTLSDALYQTGKATDGVITVVGMDQYALDVLGPFPWPRSVMADVIDVLNADADNKPAVIGVDVLYVGESADAQSDAALAAAAERGGNVVTASAAVFGTELVDTADGFYMDGDAVIAFDEPYEALAAVADSGHINAMADGDGYIRHALYEIKGYDAEPFSRVIYEKYCAYSGETPNAPPETENGFFYIPYTAGKDGYYDSISVADVLDGSVDPSYFKDRIVLIAPYAAGLQDEYRTSISHALPMYGAEIQANLIDAYRRGFFPKEVPDGCQLAILFVLCAGTFLWFWKRKIVWSVAVWLAVSGGWIGVCKLAYEKGYVLHVLWVPAACTILFITAVGIQYLRASKEKRRVTATFGRYVDPAILKELLVQGGSAEDLGGKSFDVAVLFVDIRGFTTMSESLPPATVVEILNRYLSLTTECIMRYHGTLDKFVGDCTMAFWNAPLPQDDYIYLACRAAMDMVKGSAALGEELKERFGRTVAFGVGVHTGNAVIGNIGAARRMDYTAIGDTVNTASRLESNAPAGKILISRAVADALGDRAKVTSLGGSIRLKGKAEGFEVLTLDELQ